MKKIVRLQEILWTHWHDHGNVEFSDLEWIYSNFRESREESQVYRVVIVDKQGSFDENIQSESGRSWSRELSGIKLYAESSLLELNLEPKSCSFYVSKATIRGIDFCKLIDSLDIHQDSDIGDGIRREKEILSMEECRSIETKKYSYTDFKKLRD